MACSNMWRFLVKQRMYKSFPMLMTYCLVLVFAALSVFYEFYMGVSCGDHDCIDNVLVNTQQRFEEHFNDRHKSLVYNISLFWKTRQ